MGLSLKLTMMILFVNIFLTVIFPNLVLAGNYFYELDNQGNVEVSEDLKGAMGTLGNQKAGLVSSALGMFIDGIKLIWGFLELLLRLFFASVLILKYLPSTIALFIGIPVIVAYGFAIVGMFSK